MAGAPTPQRIPEAFAIGAGGGYIVNPFPDTTGTPGAASWNGGFPPSTMTPEISGGLPPHGQDFNGVLYAISSHSFYVQSGQPYRYSAAVAASLSAGQYAVGTLLGRADGTGFWLCVTATATDPDTGGAGWVPAFNYGYATQAMAGADVTLSQAQYSKPVVVLTGVLTANVNVIVPLFLQTWLIANATTGSFTLTVKTAGGTGVVIPQGGKAAPVGVYGDGANVYPTVSPLSYPIDAAATNNTLALRTNTGGLAATAYNDSSALSNPTVGSVVVQNSAADGTYRKISLANFEAQMLLQNIGGALATGQVSQAAVGQYFNQSLNTTPLTVLFPQGSDGRRLRVEAGSTLVHATVADGANYQVVVSYSTPFNVTPFVVAIVDNSNVSAALGQCITFFQKAGETAAGFTFYTQSQTGGPTRAGNQMVTWIAIGY